MNDLLQSDVVVFVIATFGIVVSSVAILRDYLPREEPQLHVLPEPLPVRPPRGGADRAA